LQAGIEELQRVVSRLDGLEKSLSGMQKSLSGMEKKLDKNMQMILARLDRRLDESGGIETSDDQLVMSAGYNGSTSVEDTDDDAEDLKRLKEKLKEARGKEYNTRQVTVEKEPWMEYMFGICKPDGRVGKEGSR
jgi:prefoldin subunit 5